MPWAALPLDIAIMPVYTVYHNDSISESRRKWVAKELTRLHTDVTGAEPKAVKVMFFELGYVNFYVGGEHTGRYVRVVGQIRQGRTDTQKTDILEGMHKIMKEVLPKGEIQVQIQEIDDTKTVMTNGVMNV